MPTFSVVIPIFNRAATIRATLESIAAQTFRDFEVIVVDDGSTDDSVAITSEYNFVTVLQQANAGPGAARNTGIAAASGRYIAFLDSDDLWFPWTLGVYAAAISQGGEPAFLTGKHIGFTDPIEIANVKRMSTRIRTFQNYFSTGEEWLWYGVSSFVIRREILLEVGGFTSGHVNGEDAELAMRLGQAAGFLHIESPAMFGYRNHSGNITLNVDKSLAGAELLVEGEQFARFPGGRQLARIRRSIIARHLRPLSVACARQGRTRQALRYYRFLLSDTLRRARWKYFVGLPLIAGLGTVRACFVRPETDAS